MNVTPKELESGSYDMQESPKGGQERKSLVGASIPHLLLISMPRMAVRMAWAAQWAALGPYLGTMMPKYAVQLTQIIGPVTGIVVAPIVGAFSDQSTSKWGRRRPFLMYGAVTTAICWTAMGYTRQIGDALGDTGSGKKGEESNRFWTVFFTIFFYAWMDITVNVVQTPLFLMISDFAGERQTLAASLSQGWSLLGALLVSGYIHLFGAAHLTLRWFLFMLSVVMIGTVSIACFFSQERQYEKLEQLTESTWQNVKNAFTSIYDGFKSLPLELLKYCFIIFCVMYGFSAYNGNKGQFFGIVVFGGSATGAKTCEPDCTEDQDAYNHGVRIAGGYVDLLFSVVGYAYSWVLPWFVKKFGAKWVLAISLIPQSMLIIVAFSTNVPIDVIIVIFTSVTITTLLVLNVPVIVHVMGHDADIGVYVAVFNEANCLGQLVNFSIGAGVVGTSLGYKLPVFLGGIMSFFGLVFTVFILKVKMYSL
ncbi:Glycoside-Pentoside-Hexuronide (GPH):Cation Symporter Family [Phytophthora palmivora]|uniref:Glycoside-Pentoside-Hexuronide (GPH):Cation Symporter Family n=1 Tax=Phytophthora palmivora TaxID=4796 RepID=A0A2P4X988_9STRA|nr:Glycoside-Pentoside-Hexuronide (GPH):Cation Symporter Family [Phytophthora palmivora]